MRGSDFCWSQLWVMNAANCHKLISTPHLILPVHIYLHLNEDLHCLRVALLRSQVQARPLILKTASKCVSYDTPCVGNEKHKEKWKFSSFPQKHALWINFAISVVTERVANFLPKPHWYVGSFLQNKLNFHFSESLYICPPCFLFFIWFVLRPPLQDPHESRTRVTFLFLVG